LSGNFNPAAQSTSLTLIGAATASTSPPRRRGFLPSNFRFGDSFRFRDVEAVNSSSPKAPASAGATVNGVATRRGGMAGMGGTFRTRFKSCLQYLLLLTFVLTPPPALAKTVLEGDFTQGGLVIGSTDPNNRVFLDDKWIRLGPKGQFLFGFTRDAGAEAVLEVRGPDGAVERLVLQIAPREYNIQRIDGLPRKMVTPPTALLTRIRRENAAIRVARMHDTPIPYFESGFIWPAEGRISGVYGSQRILNGKPRRPHYGIDVAGPVGTPVIAPADGVVRLAERDLYYSGGTVILDHGHGLSSAFLHMHEVHVRVGDILRQGDPIGSIGATGRVTGPHLDWRINWFDQRLDAGLLVPPRN
jgi:hypothetical protein